MIYNSQVVSYFEGDSDMAVVVAMTELFYHLY